MSGIEFYLLGILHGVGFVTLLAIHCLLLKHRKGHNG